MAYFHAAIKAPASVSVLETPVAEAAAKVGVLIVNLGTPDAPTYSAVQRYLRAFLGDRRVIDNSRLVVLPLLYGLILPLRPLKTAGKYRTIWMPDGSPLAVYTKRLVDKIAAALAAAGDQVQVELAMCYGNPSIERAMKSLAENGVTRLVVLPLYPHYCSSTTASVFDGVMRALRRWRRLPDLRFINDYYDDPGYIDTVTEHIERHWKAVGERSHLVFSYHGIPASYVAKGDPYQVQAEATTRLVVQRLGLAQDDWSHCYQSRFGRVEWLQPYTIDTLKKLVEAGVHKVTVVSPSFAVDCLETLEEVAVEYRDQFIQLGGERLLLVPGLNDDEQHVAALTRIVQKKLAAQD